MVDLGLTDDWQHMLGSTTVRGHVSAVAEKVGLCAGFWSITRRLYEQNPRPLRQSGMWIGFILTGGEASD